MSIDFDSITVGQGQKVEFHFENQSVKSMIETQYDQDEFMQEVLAAINSERDLGEGIVHAIINTEGEMILLTGAKFERWSEYPSWGHLSLGDILGPLAGNARSDFLGPAFDVASQYLGDEVAFTFADENSGKENCALCIVPESQCPLRTANFDKERFDQLVSARKS